MVTFILVRSGAWCGGRDSCIGEKSGEDGSWREEESSQIEGKLHKDV